MIIILTGNVSRRFVFCCRAKVTDWYMPTYATVVRVKHQHNHMLNSADALKFRDVGDDTVEKFRELFTRGHSLSSALNVHKLDLQLEHGDAYTYEVADRAKCPDLNFCQR